MTTWDIVTGPDPWPQRYTFSPAVRAGNLLFISGTTASDKDGADRRARRHRRPDALHLPKVRRAAACCRRGVRAHRADHRVHHDDGELRPHGGGASRVFPRPLSNRHRRDRQGPAARRRADRDLGARGSRTLRRAPVAISCSAGTVGEALSNGCGREMPFRLPSASSRAPSGTAHRRRPSPRG